MEKFKKFADKFCLKELCLILFVSLVLYFVLHTGNYGYIIDVGREAYLPWQMLKGQVLYKDIFNVYGPLGYQINAIAYAIFGVKLSTLYLMGFLNSLVILFTTFFIGKLFVDKKTAMCISGLTLFVCVFSDNIFNFVFPYSYSAVYALSGFLLSLLAMLFYLRDKKNLYLTLSFFFAGFAFANKIEYLPYFCFIFVCLPFFVKKDWKRYLYSFGAFMLIPVISFGILFIQGVGINDFAATVDFIQKLMLVPAVQNFYHKSGIYFNLHTIKACMALFWAILKAVVPLVLVIYFANIYLYKKEKPFLLRLLCGFLVLFIASMLVITKFSTFNNHHNGFFGWCGCVVFVILLAWGVYSLVNFKKSEFLGTESKMYLFLLCTTVLASLKGLFTIMTNCYGTFKLAVLFIPLVVFLAKYFPQMLKFLDKKAFVNTVCILCFAVMAKYFMLYVFDISSFGRIEIKQPNGKMYVNKDYGNQNLLIKFIRDNVAQNEKMLVIPEGVMINFLAQRDSDNIYYYLNPVNVEIFGKENIIKRLNQTQPDYILYNTNMYPEYSTGGIFYYFPEIFDFINKNYIPYFRMQSQVEFILYKHK